jgi:hypothetical protein
MNPLTNQMMIERTQHGFHAEIVADATKNVNTCSLTI